MLTCILSYVASDISISTFQFNHPVYNEYWNVLKLKQADCVVHIDIIKKSQFNLVTQGFEYYLDVHVACIR